MARNRQRLAVLPLQYDSEGRLQLLPKETGRTGPQQGPSLRQLLGRSPDRADSLALAVWALSRPQPRYTIDRPLLVWPHPSYKDRRLTDEELKTRPEPLRGILEMYRNRPRRDDWDEWGVIGT